MHAQETKHIFEHAGPSRSHQPLATAIMPCRQALQPGTRMVADRQCCSKLRLQDPMCMPKGLQLQIVSPVEEIKPHTVACLLGFYLVQLQALTCTTGPS